MIGPGLSITSALPSPLAGGGAERSDAGEGAGVANPSPKFSRLMPLEFAPSRKGRGEMF
jgi:hypothetical protein